MTRRLPSAWVLLGLAAAGAAGASGWWLWSRGEDTSSQPSATPEASSPDAARPPVPPSSPQPVPQRPPPPSPEPAIQGAVAVRAGDGFGRVTVRVERAGADPGVEVVTTGLPDGTGAAKFWDDLVGLAAAAALPIWEPRGWRVVADARDVPPSIDQLAALAVAIRLASVGRPMPPDALVLGFVAPDGAIVEHATPHIGDRATAAGLRLVRGASLDALGVALGDVSPLRGPPPAPTDPPSVPATGAAVATALTEAIARSSAHKRVDPGLPPAWRRWVAQGAAHALTARPRSRQEWRTLAAGLARFREAARAVPWAVGRIPDFAEQLARSGAAIGGWRQAWLTLLLHTREAGTATVRDWAAEPLPTGSGPPLWTDDWLRRRLADARRMLGRAERTLGRFLPAARGQPRPYPVHDARYLAWPTPAPTVSTSPLAELAETVRRTAVLWTRLLLHVRFRPTRPPGATVPYTLRVADHAGLAALSAALGCGVPAAEDVSPVLECAEQRWIAAALGRIPVPPGLP